MSEDKTTIVTEAYASFGRGDVPGFFKNFDEDSLFSEAPSLPYGGDFRGPKASADALMAIGKYWKDIQYDMVEVVSGERVVIVYGMFAATSRETGKTISMPLTEVWEFDGNRVKSLTPMYFDSAAAAAALAA
jgi:ketosteroid isomerase-like protein